MKIKNFEVITFVLDDMVFNHMIKLNEYLYIAIDQDGTVKYHELEPTLVDGCYLSKGDVRSFGVLYKYQKAATGVHKIKIPNDDFITIAQRVSKRKITYLGDIIGKEFFMFDDDYNLYHYYCKKTNFDIDDEYGSIDVIATNHEFNQVPYDEDNYRFSDNDNIELEYLCILNRDKNDKNVYVFMDEQEMIAEVKRRQFEDNTKRVMDSI